MGLPIATASHGLRPELFNAPHLSVCKVRAISTDAATALFPDEQYPFTRILCRPARAGAEDPFPTLHGGHGRGNECLRAPSNST